MSDDFIQYWLPMTSLNVKGVITKSKDDILAKSSVESLQTELSLEVVPDGTAPAGGTPGPYVAKVHHGWLYDTSVSLELTDDRRLVSASSETSGQAGKVILGVAGAAAAGVSIATGFAPGATIASSVLGAAAGYRAFAVADEAALAEEIRGEAKTTDERKVADAFLLEHRQVALARKHFSKLALQLLEDLERALKAVEKAENDHEHERAVGRVLSCQKALAVARSETARLDAIFDAWRATKIHQSTERLEFSLPISEAIGSCKDNAQWKLPAQPNKHIVDILGRLGVWLVFESVEQVGGGGLASLPENLRAETRQNGRPTGEGILLRQPRKVVLCIYQYFEDGRASQYPVSDKAGGSSSEAIKEDDFSLVERRESFVVDSDCRHEFIPFRKSLWGRRTVKLTLSPLGGLKTYSAEATSSAAAVAETAGALPSTVRGALEEAGKIRGELDALRDRSLDLKIAELKKRIDLKNQELALAGIDATEADFAELERLKQEQAILEAQLAIRKSQTELGL